MTESHEPTIEDVSENTPKLDQGFSLVAGIVLGILLVVLCPVLIIAAMVGPSLVEARSEGNMASAVGNLKSLSTGQALFREKNPKGEYGSLTELGTKNFVDSALASGLKQEYKFESGLGHDAKKLYWAKASPVVPGKGGTRYFFMNQSGIIYYSLNDFQIDKLNCKPKVTLKRLGSP